MYGRLIRRKHFIFKLFCLVSSNSNNSVKHKYAVNSNPSIGSYQVLPRRVRVNLGAMAMKGCSTFPKTPASVEPHHQIV